MILGAQAISFDTNGEAFNTIAASAAIDFRQVIYGLHTKTIRIARRASDG